MLHRPSDNYGFEGFTDVNNKYHAGLLDQLKTIYIDEFVRCILNNQEPKHGIIFFRTENQLIFLLNYLREILGQCIASSAPFVCLLSSTPPVTELVISKRCFIHGILVLQIIFKIKKNWMINSKKATLAEAKHTFFGSCT